MVKRLSPFCSSNFLGLLFACTLCACASHPPTFNSDDIIIAADKVPGRPSESLSANQVSYDIDYLKYVLDRGYAGRDFLPAGAFDLMMRRLDEIHSSMTPTALRDRIDEILTDVPDGHLLARIGPNRSEYRSKMQPEAKVGNNSYPGTPDKPWQVKIISLDRRKVLLISILTFPFHEASVWKGFLDEVEKSLKKVSAAIIDLRGNDGGDDTIGFEMAYLFNGGQFRQPVDATIERNTPENKALVSNIFSYTLARMKEMSKTPEPYVRTRLDEAQARYKLAKEQKLDGYTEKPEGDYLSKNLNGKSITAFGKSIFILMDRKCASSCESTIDAFEFIKGVTKIGEPMECGRNSVI